MTKYAGYMCIQNIFLKLTNLWCFSVVWLCLTKPSSMAPVTGITLSSRSDFCSRTGPKPTINIGRYQVGSITSVKVTFSS